MLPQLDVVLRVLLPQSLPLRALQNLSLMPYSLVAFEEGLSVLVKQRICSLVVEKTLLVLHGNNLRRALGFLLGLGLRALFFVELIEVDE